jgi:hypothetical protein
LTEETSASSIYYIQLRVDRFIIDFVLNLIINILIGFGCGADHFSNTGRAASRESFLTQITHWTLFERKLGKIIVKHISSVKN